MLKVTLKTGEVLEYPAATVAISSVEQGCVLLCGLKHQDGSLNSVAWFPIGSVARVESEKVSTCVGPAAEVGQTIVAADDGAYEREGVVEVGAKANVTPFPQKKTTCNS